MSSKSPKNPLWEEMMRQEKEYNAMVQYFNVKARIATATPPPPNSPSGSAAPSPTSANSMCASPTSGSGEMTFSRRSKKK